MSHQHDLPERPPLPRTPDDALGALARRTVRLGGRTFVLEHPANADVLLDHPSTQAAFDRDEYLPYWADLWPAARLLAEFVLEHPWVPGTSALEAGCGLGLVGIAALAAGLRVTFSDYDATAVRFAAGNARLNGFADFDILQMDWRYPPEGLRAPVLLAADLTYEMRSVGPVVGFIKAVLSAEGTCYLTDADRTPALSFRQELDAQGMAFTTEERTATAEDGKACRGTLYCIRHPASRAG